MKMFKKILAVCFILALIPCFCACDELGIDLPFDDWFKGSDAAEPQRLTPEQVAKDFITAYFHCDTDAFFELIPEFSYEAMAEVFDVEYEDKADMKSKLYDYMEHKFNENKRTVEMLEVTTKISTEISSEKYINTVREYYVEAGFLTEDQIDELFKEVAIVQYSGKFKYADGEQDSIGEGAFAPCVKIDGKWYVDFFFAALVTVPSKPTTTTLPVQTAPQG